MKNTWKTKSSTLIYDNPWICLREDQVINPSGNDGIYGVVHFKNKAIGIIPIDEEGNTYLVGQWRYALGEYSWEIPMGGSPLDVEPLEGAKRELLEETGLTAEKWELLGRIHTSNSVTDEEGFIFVAQQLQQGNSFLDETEDITVWKLPLKEAIDMVISGKITDSLSMAGLLWVGRMMKI
jgi:8-oxo-dGTP pyrophosphatase MutT (NUDIX family)